MAKALGTSYLDCNDSDLSRAGVRRREQKRWMEVRKLQPFVLAGGVNDWVSRTEFLAEPEEEQERYLRWLRLEAADIEREER